MLKQFENDQKDQYQICYEEIQNPNIIKKLLYKTKPIERWSNIGKYIFIEWKINCSTINIWINYGAMQLLHIERNYSEMEYLLEEIQYSLHNIYNNIDQNNIDQNDKIDLKFFIKELMQTIEWNWIISEHNYSKMDYITKNDLKILIDELDQLLLSYVERWK